MPHGSSTIGDVSGSWPRAILSRHVVEICQAVQGDRGAVKDAEADADDPRIAQGLGGGMQHDESAVGEDFAEFVDALHPEAQHVPVAMRRIDGIKPVTIEGSNA
jgi:hypothetical protein